MMIYIYCYEDYDFRADKTEQVGTADRGTVSQAFSTD